MSWSLRTLLRCREPAIRASAACNIGVERVIASRPDWVQRQISSQEARLIAAELKVSSATTALEIGCASGYSAAVIYAQLAENDPGRCEYRGFDRARRCYFDPLRKTGQAFWELQGTTARGSFTTGVTSADIKTPGWRFLASDTHADFAFVDAGHRGPWPALDLLSLARFLKKDAVIALHDLHLVFRKRFRHYNGPRDLFRCWQGEKWTYDNAPNIGFLRRGSDDIVIEGIANALSCDWDEPMDPRQLRKYRLISEGYGAQAAARLSRALGGERPRHVTPALFRNAPLFPSQAAQPISTEE